MKMFGFSKKRMKIGRLKVQLSDSAQGTPMRQPKRLGGSNGGNGGVAPASNDSEESSGAPELNSGGSENWMVLSITGDKPIPRFNHAAAVVGNKMVIVGGESATEMLEDVQVLNFDQFSWTNASSKLHLSPTSLPLKIPACKGHTLIAWGKKVLLIGGKTDPSSEKLSVWAFDTETECWSLMEAKGDIPVARSGHTVVRASSTLILFGGEDSKRRKLKDLHMFDLKSLTWLPLSLNCTGSGPSPRSNHVSALYDDKLLLVFGGSSKSRTLNDLYSLDFDTMIWSSIKVRGFHPSPRAGCCGVLCGSKWYIAGGGTRTKRHVETLVFDVLKHEWSVSSPSSSVTTNKGFSLVLVQHKERDFLVAFGGLKKDPSNQVEVLMVERNDLSFNRSSIISKNAETSIGVASQTRNGIDAIARQNLASAIEHHGSGRRSLSETLHADPNSISLRKQFYNDEKNPEEESQATMSGSSKLVTEEHSGTLKTHHRQGSESFPLEIDDDGKSGYEAKVNSLIRKNGILEGQLAVALANKETAEKNACCAIKSKQDMEKQLCDALKEMEMLKEKVSGLEMAQDEANSLSNIVHSDNVRLEHDVAFLKAVLDDTQKELHSTRGVLAGERARAFQLQVEVFHVKQRLQSLENRTQTPRKPFHM